MFALDRTHAYWVTCVFGVSMLAGCGGEVHRPQENPSGATAAHDPDDVPITEADVRMPANYAEAVGRIKSYRDAIRSAIEAGTPSKAHCSLDELDIVLGKLPSIARDSGIAKSQWETINVTARELREHFDRLHSAIDAGREPDYAAVSKGVDERIRRLAQIVPPAGR